jgi:hypothetical protein
VNVAVVIPTIREECALRWIEEWKDDLADARIILVEDNPEPTFETPGIEHYSWRDFESDLGRDAWIIPRRTSACRSYGFLKALERPETDIIWTLDDDCYPEEKNKGHYLEDIEGALSTRVEDHNAWWNTISHTGLYPRGFPYGIRDRQSQVMLHHGLWSNIPDLDGITQLDNPDFRLQSASAVEVVPYGKLFPMCIMNVAFRCEIAPLMYMLLMGEDDKSSRWGYDRFDDIWAGLFVKLAADKLGYAVSSGAPSIYHSRASDPHRNAELEAPGMEAHEEFWRYIQSVKLSGADPGDCYLELADALELYTGDSPRSGYWHSLAAAMRIWVRQSENRL